MKLKTALLTLVAAACMAVNASAILIGLNDPRTLGLIDPNHPADPTDTAGFVDILLDQPLGSGPTVIGANAYTRTLNDPLAGNYPAAVFSVEQGIDGTLDLGQTGFLYLVAKYDGPNYGSVVWYIGGLTGSNVTIPTTADGFGLSHTYLFNPQGGVIDPRSTVPDGGSTVAMLGGALMLLGFAASKFNAVASV